MNQDPRDGHRGATFYDVLQVSPTASQEVIQAAYRALARGHHPDVNPSAAAAQRMLELNAAYAVLGDAERRARYDLGLMRSSRPVVGRASLPVVELRGRPRPSSPRRVGDERAAAAASLAAWTPARPRIILAVAVVLILTLTVSLVLWITSEFLDDLPDALSNEQTVITLNPSEVSRAPELRTRLDGRGAAQPLLNHA